MSFRQNIITWERDASNQEQQLRVYLHQNKLYPSYNEPVSILMTLQDLAEDEEFVQLLAKHLIEIPVTTGDVVFHAGHKYIIKDGCSRHITFVDGPPHWKDKNLDRDPVITRLLESPKQLIKSKVYRILNPSGGPLSQKTLEEARRIILESVEPIKK